MNTNNYEDIEISIIDMIGKILSKWRSIIVAMLIGMVAIGAFGAYKNAKDNNATVMSVVDDTNFKFTSLEENEANQLMKTATSYQKAIDSKREYLDNSILAELNPDDVPEYNMQYTISNGSNNMGMGQMGTFVEAYKAAICNNDTYEEISEALKPQYDVKSQYIAELISIRTLNDGNINLILNSDNDDVIGTYMMTVNICGIDEAFCKTIADVIDKHMQAATKDVSVSIGSHQIKYIGGYALNTIDRNIASTILNENIAITDLQTRLTNLTKDLTDSEKAYVKRILTKTEATDLDAKEATNTDTAIQGNTSASMKSVLSVKYILGGAIAGIFIMICIYGCKYLFSHKIHVSSEIEEALGIPSFGVFRSKRVDSLGGLDKAIDKFTNAGELTIGHEEMLRVVCNKIKFGAEKLGVNSIAITGTKSGDEVNELYGELEKALKNEGLTISRLGNLTYDDMAMRQAKDIEAIVIIESLENSDRDDIIREVQFCESITKPIIGAAFLR